MARCIRYSPQENIQNQFYTICITISNKNKKIIKFVFFFKVHDNIGLLFLINTCTCKRFYSLQCVLYTYLRVMHAYLYIGGLQETTGVLFFCPFFFSFSQNYVITKVVVRYKYRYIIFMHDYTTSFRRHTVV